MPLNAADLPLLSRLLDQALELPAAEREAWLAALPSEHQHHAHTLRGMLAERDSTRGAAFLAAGPQLAGDEAVASPGERVGAYRLLREIGRGGMGSVWLAERADGVFQRQVALKLPRLAWGAGLAERMAREREIGARLEHPAIARLYDAGVDERGRPYLALEYIEGQPIDAWCEAQALDVPARLRLFVQVVHAVAYAHGRLVVHRDLKPSNVMVGADGQAHLLDFGIAKLLHDEAPGPGLTQEQGRLLTPHYAAPEQLAGEPVTVQSDVYSLGVLLYELLTGTLPIQPRRPTLGAVEEAVLQGDVPPASSRAKDKATARALRGELDAVLAKALQREPQRRYATADALAQDIQRHLAGETVSARPDSLGYRLRKALRRHWVGFGAAAAVLVAVLAGGAVSAVQAQRAARAAERERVVKTFVADVFRINTRNVTGEAALRRLPADMLLEHSAKLIRQRFAGQPELQAELYGVVGGIFADMGAAKLAVEYVTLQVETLVTLRASNQDQGAALITLAEALLDQQRPADAEPRARRALEMVGGDAPLRSRAMVVLARAQIGAGRYEEAVQTLDRVDAMLAQAKPPQPREKAWVLALRGETLVRNNRFADAYPLYQQAVAAAMQAEGPQSLSAAAIRLQAVTWYWQVGDYERADALFEPAIAALKAAGGAHAIRAVVESARRFRSKGSIMAVSMAEADDGLKRCIEELQAFGDAVPPAMIARIELARAYIRYQWGDVSSVVRDVDRVASVVLKASEQTFERFLVQAEIASPLQAAGRHAEAAVLHEERLQHRIATGRGKHPYAANSYAALARNALMGGDVTAALRALDSAPEFEPLRVPGYNPQRYNNLLREVRARVLLNSGDVAGALAVLPQREPVLQDLAQDAFDSTPRAVRGEAWCRTGKHKEGLPLLAAHLAEHEKVGYLPQAPHLASLRATLGFCALRAGQRSRAIALAAQARAAFITQPEVSPYYKAPLLELERALGCANAARNCR